MTDNEEFNEERARDFTINCLRAAASTLKVNRELCMQIMMKEFGAPDEATADQALRIVQMLLGHVAGHVSKGVVLDATKKPDGDSKAVH